jgi:hypothetical protein
MSTSVNLTFDQRSTFSLVLFRARDQRNLPIDLSGLMGVSAFKINYTTGNTAFSLPVMTNADGEVIIYGDAEQTDVKPGRYVFDVLLSDGNRIVSGLATVIPAIAEQPTPVLT